MSLIAPAKEFYVILWNFPSKFNRGSLCFCFGGWYRTIFVTCKPDMCHCFCAQTFLSSNVFVQRWLIKCLRPKSSWLKLNDGIGPAKVPPFIVQNPHIFTEEEALMCTEGRDKVGDTNTNHTDIFHKLVIVEELRFVALEWTGKHLYVCLRVAQGGNANEILLL